MRNLKEALPSEAGVAIRGARGTPGHTHVRAWRTIPEPTSVPVPRHTLSPFHAARVRRQTGGTLM